jgi:hypothetical protein
MWYIGKIFLVCPENFLRWPPPRLKFFKCHFVFEKWPSKPASPPTFRSFLRPCFNDYSRASHVSPMIDHLCWDNLQQRRVLHQATMFYKIHQGLVGISLPDDVCPLTRASRLPDICPYRQIQSCVNVYTFLFYPRTLVTWNQIQFNNLCQSTPSFKTLGMPSIKSLNVAN